MCQATILDLCFMYILATCLHYHLLSNNCIFKQMWVDSIVDKDDISKFLTKLMKVYPCTYGNVCYEGMVKLLHFANDNLNQPLYKCWTCKNNFTFGSVLRLVVDVSLPNPNLQRLWKSTRISFAIKCHISTKIETNKNMKKTITTTKDMMKTLMMVILSVNVCILYRRW